MSGLTKVWTLPRTERVCDAGILLVSFVKVFDYLLCYDASGLIRQNPLTIRWILIDYLPYVRVPVFAADEYRFLIDCFV